MLTPHAHLQTLRLLWRVRTVIMATTTHYRKLAARPRPITSADTVANHRERQRQACLDVLHSLDCLREVPARELEPLVDMCVFRAFAPGATIIWERRPGEFLYLVLQGSVRLMLHDKEGHEVLLGVLDRGDCCGEGPLFGDLFRRAGAYAETYCYLLQLPLADVRTLLPSAPRLEAALHAIYRRRLVESTLARVPLFSSLSPVERVALAELLQPAHYDRNQVIVRQGQCGHALHLIESGQVVVEDDAHTIATLDEGDFFGEMALLFNRPHSASVRALTPVDVLSLPAGVFEDILARRPDLKARLDRIVEQRRANSEAVRSDHERSQRLMTVVEHGLLRGSHLLVRDPALCPAGCTICESACAARHGQPRLQLNGVMIDDLDVVDACRQCRVGAECVEACPEDAFEWNDRGALFITDKCTGCGLCIPACPYDAIARVPRTPDTTDGPLWRLWGQMQRRLHQRFFIPLEPVPYTHRADKCDLCHGYDDMACVSACPTGALRLVPVEELFPL